MTINHHPDPATLLAFAAGTLGEALGAVVACHLDMCRDCRREARLMAAIGGALIEAEPPGVLSPEAIRVAEAAPLPAASAPAPRLHTRTGALGLPAPLVHRLGMSLADVPWKWLAPGARYFSVPQSPEAKGDLRLLMVQPGVKLPAHGHVGTELTLVLSGAYRDEHGHYRPGDVEDVDGEAEHQPVVDADAPCVCLIASETPLRYKGLVPRLLQPLTGM